MQAFTLHQGRSDSRKALLHAFNGLVKLPNGTEPPLCPMHRALNADSETEVDPGAALIPVMLQLLPPMIRRAPRIAFLSNAYSPI